MMNTPRKNNWVCTPASPSTTNELTETMRKLAEEFAEWFHKHDRSPSPPVFSSSIFLFKDRSNPADHKEIVQQPATMTHDPPKTTATLVPAPREDLFDCLYVLSDALRTYRMAANNARSLTLLLTEPRTHERRSGANPFVPFTDREHALPRWNDLLDLNHIDLMAFPWELLSPSESYRAPEQHHAVAPIACYPSYEMPALGGAYDTTFHIIHFSGHALALEQVDLFDSRMNELRIQIIFSLTSIVAERQSRHRRSLCTRDPYSPGKVPLPFYLLDACFSGETKGSDDWLAVPKSITDTPEHTNPQSASVPPTDEASSLPIPVTYYETDTLDESGVDAYIVVGPTKAVMRLRTSLTAAERRQAKAILLPYVATRQRGVHFWSTTDNLAEAAPGGVARP
jgi:hypothetical protein